MQIASTIQNRQLIRIPISLQVIGKIMLNFFQKHSLKGESLNVSYGGICFKTNVNGLQVGQKIELETCLYEGDSPIKVKGQVCWMHSNDDFPRSINIGVKLNKTRHHNLWCSRVDKALSLARLQNF